MRRVLQGRFPGDERGGGTIWALFWFLLLIAFAGLAVDTTDGLRTRTMLQATADSAALAAAIDLPDTDAAVDTAVAYAAINMTRDRHGTVLAPEDVVVGRWDPETATMRVDDPEPDAVWVTVHRSAANDNPVPANLLRIIGLQSWNVKAQAVAQKFIPDCIHDGLIARGIVDLSSSNAFARPICVHGQAGVHMQNHNRFEAGTTVSMPGVGMLQIPSGGMDSNPGLPEALRENILDPRMVNHVDEVMQRFLDLDPAVLPAYIDPTRPVVTVDEKFDLATAEAGRVYHVECKPNKNAAIPSNATIREVVIIAECEIRIGAKATLVDVGLGSRSGGARKVDKANIGVSANVQLGRADGCAEGGGVQLFSNATIHTASSTKIDGVQMVARGNIELGARDDGIDGISAQSGRDITLTSNNQFGICAGGVPDLFTVPYYRLVL